MIHFNVGFKSDIGQKRQQNQDAGAAFPELGLFVVADGMGGHRGGETASAMAVENISQMVRHAQQKPNWTPREALVDAIRKANKAIYERSLKQPQLQGMGTTTTALLFSDTKCTIGHVGDSRCYLIKHSALWQLTRDHSLVQEKLRAGLITRDQLKTDRMKNVITRSVGFEDCVHVDIYEFEFQPGDIFLICSDGLSGMTDDRAIRSIVDKLAFGKGDIQKATDALIDSANANGGDDNVTAILIQIPGAGQMTN